MRAAVFYATGEGQAEHVAQRVGHDLRARLVHVDLIDVRVRGTIDWKGYDMAFVIAPVHTGHHEKEMIEFVKRSKKHLTKLHAPFL